MQTYIPREQCVVWVHTWWKRDGVRDATIQSLGASDVGDFEVMRQGPDDDPVGFFVATLQALCARPGVKWLLRLEDDTLVNTHLWHNVSTWDVPHREADFGIGFLSWPLPVLSDVWRIGHGKATKAKYRFYPEMHFGGGMLYQCKTLAPMLPALGERMRLYMGDNPNQGIPFACVPSRMFFERQLWSYFHAPAIVKIDLSIPRSRDGKVVPSSVLGGQDYRPTWRRTS